MSFVSQVLAVVQRIGAEIKTLRGEVVATKLYQPTSYLPGVPAASTTLLLAVSAVQASFPTSFTGSYATADVAATASTVLTVKKGTVTVGTITFAAGAAVGTFVAASITSLAPGEKIAVYAPATPDATLAGIAIVLAGTRST